MKTYNASYTASVFLTDSNEGVEYKCWRGPVGNGKSVGMVMFIYKESAGQVPTVVEENGERKRVRWSKWLIARHTHKALEETTIETMNEWLGDRLRWHNNYANGEYEEPLPDGTLLRIEFVCHATESPNILSDLQSLELSGAWVNEAVYTPLRVISRIHSRIGRFNPNPQGGVRLKHFPVIMDTNSPDETNWWYVKECVERPEGWRFYVSPPALLARKDPVTGAVRYVPNDGRDFASLGIRAAENVREVDGGYHEGWGYWLKQVAGADPDELRKLILNQFGTSVAGMPVFPEWVDSTHCVHGEIPYQRGLALCAGMDLGRTPACVIGQMGPNGALYALREVTTWEASANGGKGGLRRMDVGQFADELLKPVIVNEFGCPVSHVKVFCDPAGKNFNEVVSVSAVEMLRRHGVNAVPCDRDNVGYSFEQRNANEVRLRLRCVSENLRRTCGGVPAIQVSDRCEMLRKGFNGKYCYRRLRTGGDDERYSDDPDKNDYSHVQDAFQYLCMAMFLGAVDYSRPVGDTGPGYDVFRTPMPEVGFDCI